MRMQIKISDFPTCDSNCSEPTLVPVRIDLEFDGTRVRDAFLWSTDGMHTRSFG